MIAWSEIEAECGDYREGFVAVFRKYEGQKTDEKDGQGRTVKVTASSFARHVGIPERTFLYWVSAAAQAVLPEERIQKDATRARTDIRRLPPEERAKLAGELLAEPEVAEQVVADPNAQTRIRSALIQHDEATTRQPESDRSPDPDPFMLVADFRKLHRTVERIAQRIGNGGSVVNNAQRDALLEEIDWLRNALELMEAGLRDGSLDSALAQILGESS